MAEKVITGWIANNKAIEIENGTTGKHISIPWVANKKGFHVGWGSRRWPPRKVRITIEEV